MHLPPSNIREILQKYTLGSLKSSKLLYSSCNIAYHIQTTKGEYVLKLLLVSGKADLENELLTLHQLDKSIPHVLPIPTSEGADYLVWKKRFIYIVPYVKGTIVHDGSRLSPKALSEVGRQLAKIHKTSIRTVRDRDIHQEFKKRFGKQKESLAKKTLTFLEEKKFYSTQFPNGFLHVDLHTENIIFRRGKIVAILDFEESYKGPFIHDIGWTMMDTCFKAGKLSKQRMQYFLRGYERVRKLNAIERRHLENAILHAGLLELQYVDKAKSKGQDFSDSEASSAFRNRLIWLLSKKQ